jgi:hypothetical protein
MQLQVYLTILGTCMSNKIKLIMQLKISNKPLKIDQIVPFIIIIWGFAIKNLKIIQNNFLLLSKLLVFILQIKFYIIKLF